MSSNNSFQSGAVNEIKKKKKRSRNKGKKMMRYWHEDALQHLHVSESKSKRSISNKCTQVGAQNVDGQKKKQSNDNIQKKDSKKPRREPDPNLQFFKSLRHDLEKLNERNAMEFRITVLTKLQLLLNSQDEKGALRS